MSGSSRYTRAISAEVGEIERRLRSLEKNLQSIGARTSIDAKDTAESLGDAIASALGRWADRLRQGASVLGGQSAVISKDAAKFGGVTLRRVSDEVEERPLLTVAVALGVGILIGMVCRGWD
jgi:ElaB/YqjD/DUF883 family membrane-anchored ribosome-binding protein